MSFIFSRSKLKGWGESEIVLLHLIERRCIRNLRFVTKSVEPDYLDSGVLEVDFRVKIEHQLAEGSGVGGKSLETMDRQPGVESMSRRERIFSIAEILPAAETSYEHTQIWIGHKDRERNRLQAPVQCIPRAENR